jgi:REP element-mobilizing transposase RayT
VTYDPRVRRRRSIRLKGYDYARAGAYFITICTRGRACLFGDLVAGKMRLNDFGKIVQATWSHLPDHYQIELDAFIVMPNHVHGIVVIGGTAAGAGAGSNTGVPSPPVGAGFKPAPTTASVPYAGTTSVPYTGATPPPNAPATPIAPAAKYHGLTEIVRGFKTFSARRINEHRRTPGTPVWQRNYYEHIIRDEAAFRQIRRYIMDNPARWAFDRHHPSARRS